LRAGEGLMGEDTAVIMSQAVGLCENSTVTGPRTSRLACASLAAWVVSMAAAGVSFWLDHYAPYREIRGYPKDEIESYLLMLANFAALAGAILGACGVVTIRRSGGRVRGRHLAVAGLVLSIVTAWACGYRLLVTFVMTWMSA